MRNLLLVSTTIFTFIVPFVNGEKQRDDFKLGKLLLAEEILKEFLTNDADRTVGKCPSLFTCWPGKCFVQEEQQFCLCPEGYSFENGRCIRNRNSCKNLSCYPGECNKQKSYKSCLCPEGYYSDRGMCKEFRWNCQINDCRPGKCIKEFNVEKCLCPEGFTTKAGRCVEIAHTSAKQVSTVMLMIIVAIASVMLTTFFGICICYFTTRNNSY